MNAKGLEKLVEFFLICVVFIKLKISKGGGGGGGGGGCESAIF